MPRIAETPPVRCSGCGLQQPHVRHVDFDVAWDGPVIQGGVVLFDGERSPTVPVPIDDLILCEPCVVQAGRLLGLEPQDQTTIQQLEDELAGARDANLELRKHVDEQDRALKSRDSFGRQAPGRKPGKQRVAA
jgi:hypothetical protein